MEFLNNLTKTRKNYLHDTYKFIENGSIVLKVGELEENNDIRDKYSCTHYYILDQTILHAQGGGQPSDIGIIECENKTTFHVNFVKDENGIIFHYGGYGKFNTDNDNDTSNSNIIIPSNGDVVKVVVNEEKRRVFARLHSIGHALDACIMRLGLEESFEATKGYHFQDGPYVEYRVAKDFDKSILDTLSDQLNEKLKEVVEEKIETEIKMMSQEDAGILCKCDTSTYPDEVRVLIVASFPCPCGGTHVTNTSEFGEVKVTKCKKKKDLVKISYQLLS